MFFCKCVHESTITCMFPCITPVSAHFWPPLEKGPLFCYAIKNCSMVSSYYTYIIHTASFFFLCIALLFSFAPGAYFHLSDSPDAAAEYYCKLSPDHNQIAISGGHLPIDMRHILEVKTLSDCKYRRTIATHEWHLILYIPVASNVWYFSLLWDSTLDFSSTYRRLWIIGTHTK